MAKKGLLVLIIAVLVAGGAFAQNDFASMAKNTITVDVGPTILGVAVGQLSNIMKGMGGMEDMDIGDLPINTNGFGIAGQYERQLSRPLSVALRGAYLSVDLGMAISDARDGVSGSAKTDISLASFSVEGHVRFYPLGNTFFLDGMIGYANLKAAFSGSMNAEYDGETVVDEHISSNPSRNYLKLGAKLGWRISFGKNGGFTFEPAIGYSYGIGLGDTIAKQLSKDLGGGDPIDLDEPLSYIENLIFIGGPRFSLAFGYRF
jgi:hypothetical protein